MGGAAGETFVADIERIGTFGDMIGGPTKLDREPSDTNRGEALRKLLNRTRFASEGIVLTPFVYGVGRGAKELALRGKELAYSDSQFLRLVDKVGGAFRARGRKPQEVFEAKMRQMGRKMGMQKKQKLSNYMTKQIDEMFPTSQRVFDKSVQKEKDKFLAQLDDVLFKGNLRNKIDQPSWDKITKTMKDKIFLKKK